MAKLRQRNKLGNCCNNPFKKLSVSERVMARWGEVDENDSRSAESTRPRDWLNRCPVDLKNVNRLKDCAKKSQMNSDLGGGRLR